VDYFSFGDLSTSILRLIVSCVAGRSLEDIVIILSVAADGAHDKLATSPFVKDIKESVRITPRNPFQALAGLTESGQLSMLPHKVIGNKRQHKPKWLLR
jgi:hypothetical protein